MTQIIARALVTGGRGFIGRALIRRLAAEGITVVAHARQPGWEDGTGVPWSTGDLTDAVLVDRLVARARPDVIFHLAGAVTGSRHLDAVLPTATSGLLASINVLKSATEAGCQRVVLIGSGDEPRDGAVPCSPYAAAKWATGGYARMFHELYGTPVATARPFMVYGPDQPDLSKVVPYTIACLQRGETPKLSSGRRLCDWVYVDDVVEALLAVAVAPECIDEVVDVGTGVLHSVRHVVETLCRLSGRNIRPEFGAVPERHGETEHVANIEATTRLCGWAPSTELVSGLERTLSWYRRAQAD